MYFLIDVLVDEWREDRKTTMSAIETWCSFCLSFFFFSLYFMFVFLMLSSPGDINVNYQALYPLLWGCACLRACVHACVRVCVCGGEGAIKMV